MADDGGSGEKTEEPTPERLRKLREEGNVSKSQDVVSAVSFLVVFCALAWYMHFISSDMIAFTHDSIRIAFNTTETNETQAKQVLLQGLWKLTKATLPVLLVAMVIGYAMNVAQVGFLFSSKPITPDFNKLNPVNGFKNMFNMKKVVELLKTIIKFTLVAWLSYSALNKAIRDVAFILRSDLMVGTKVIGSIIWDFCTKIGGAFIVIAGFDAFYQHQRYIKDNMMSKHDIKQEYKQNEGDPQLKADRKHLHQEILNNSGGSAVKGADAVIRNPDHIAIAIKYNKEAGTAPEVVAKGTRIWAEKILEEAKKYGVPVIRNVPLAQALNKCEVGDEIPEELFEAVAEVLTFVYKLAEEQKKKQLKK